MASRRSRIKGITNIPQRRRNDNEATDSKKLDLPEINTNSNDKPNEEIIKEVKELEKIEFIKPKSVDHLVEKKIDNTEKSSEKKITKNVIILDNSIIHPICDTISDTIKNSNLEKLTELPINLSTNLELDYPPPPPSPTRISRTRIKAVPLLRQRHHSFSASESEDESRRSNRIRNDSLCSNTTTSGGLPDPPSITESPCTINKTLLKKDNILTTPPTRKLHRNDITRKIAEARRDFYFKFGRDKPDRQKLTMMDLIFYNPNTNLMSSENCLRKTEIKELQENPDDPDDPDETYDNNKLEESDEENSVPAPQIKIGPQGDIILDEQSLVIESKSVKKGREELKKSVLVDGNNETSTYKNYKKTQRAKYWSEYETLKFYKALNTVGSDFTLMCELFPNRTRRELKLKFKKEEKNNKHLIDKAILEPCKFNFKELKLEVDLEDKEIQRMKQIREENRKNPNKRKLVRYAEKGRSKTKRQRFSEIIEPKTNTSNYISIETVQNIEDNYNKNIYNNDSSHSDSCDSDVSNDANGFTNILQPTRSGRIPKILNRYQSSNLKNSKNNTIKNENSNDGNISDVTSNSNNGNTDDIFDVNISTTSEGESVVKIFMLTPEKQKKNTFGNGIVSQLTKSLDNNENNQNICTITISKPKNSNDEDLKEIHDNSHIPLIN